MAVKRRFIGGANLERSWFIQRERCGTTFPFGFLHVEESEATVGGLLGMPSVKMRAEVTRAFRSRGFLCWGVGFRLHGEVHYFWTFTPTKVLQTLAESGFHIEGDEWPNLIDLFPGSGVGLGGSGPPLS
jgi:hypothetical protein